ncbi:nuclear transport factor 2 family protein [Aliiglaciecola sp. CAU 1673]|uniref:nuclear transport factor 2 family protein n=1 Tax=Aliiglaciecola sp. CAU 1673 TaxID=3032595 RepID=UPI0023DC8B4A|nr:nuclear transport factor 2 family protein [Aliiglaciecola sp. CAU 1673]MDF2180358.1 nuclear transport factor 2 family protein [Aliiglaciecola sp. CAU 1673]
MTTVSWSTAYGTESLAKPTPSSDFEMVQLAIQKYFDGTSKGTPELLTEVFHPDLKLQFIQEDKLVTWMGKDYIAGFETGVTYNRKGRVVSIDITGTAAMVKAEIEMNDSIYVDYLLLLKAQGKWTITHKTFALR